MAGGQTRFLVGTSPGTPPSGYASFYISSSDSKPHYILDTGVDAALGTGSGTVTSVAMTVPSFLGISGSPITVSGTLALTLSGTALPVANGGTGLTAGTSGGILYYSASGTLASSAALAANQIVLGGGAGATPATLGSLGTTTTVLHGNAAGAPTFAAVSLTADISGTLPVANGGTGATSGTVAFLGNNNAFTKAQAVAWSTLTDAATIAVDASLSNNFVVTLAGNRTLGAPTNLTDGQVINLMTIQDATGSRTLAYNSVYKFAGGTATVLSTAVNAVDMQTFVYRSSTGFLYNTGAVKALA